LDLGIGFARTWQKTYKVEVKVKVEKKE